MLSVNIFKYFSFIHYNTIVLVEIMKPIRIKTRQGRNSRGRRKELKVNLNFQFSSLNNDIHAQNHLRDFQTSFKLDTMKSFPIFNYLVEKHVKEVKMDSQTIQDLNDEENCQRRVFIPSIENTYKNPDIIHYYISTKLYYQNIDKCANNDLPRKRVSNSWNSLETVVFVKNSKLETKFEEIKAKFQQEGKVDAYGSVSELLLFHGTSHESINNIVEHNFCLQRRPDSGHRDKVTLFGHGIYFSELPGVSLMYGAGLLLCKAWVNILPNAQGRVG